MKEDNKTVSIEEIVNMISHDIRNPLAAIKNGIYYIGYSVKSDNPRVKITVDIINKEIDNIKKILDDLTGYSRQREQSLCDVNVGMLADEILAEIKIPDNIIILKDIDESLPDYLLDREEMRQIITNVVNNAWQSCDKEECRVSIRIFQDSNGNLNIGISDNGIGIADENKDRIFEPFYTTKDGGTGLGLAAVKKLVKRHNGSVALDSTVGEGTDFIISIPRK
ncbi:MAG: ATP-binding protein [Elusimicrobiota bacterium]